MPIDLNDFRYRDEDVMDVIPPGYPAGIATIIFAGPGHARSVFSEKRRYAIARRGPAMDADEAARRSVMLVVDRMIGWAGFEEPGEKAGELVEVPFSEDKATELLLDPRFGWLFTQCLIFLNSPESFLPKPKTR